MTDLAEVMAAIDAPWLAWAVHTADAPLVAELLEPLTRQELYALAVALASQVPRPRTPPRKRRPVSRCPCPWKHPFPSHHEAALALRRAVVAWRAEP